VRGDQLHLKFVLGVSIGASGDAGKSIVRIQCQIIFKNVVANKVSQLDELDSFGKVVVLRYCFEEINESHRQVQSLDF
jgi:hypothetical protein